MNTILLQRLHWRDLQPGETFLQIVESIPKDMVDRVHNHLSPPARDCVSKKFRAFLVLAEPPDCKTFSMAMWKPRTCPRRVAHNPLTKPLLEGFVSKLFVFLVNCIMPDTAQ
jgi:hypothetical protein